MLTDVLSAIWKENNFFFQITGKTSIYSYQDLSCFSFFWSGAHLLSHTVSSAVPSADWVLTVVFGMGTGVSPNRIGTRNIRVT